MSEDEGFGNHVSGGSSVRSGDYARRSVRNIGKEKKTYTEVGLTEKPMYRVDDVSEQSQRKERRRGRRLEKSRRKRDLKSIYRLIPLPLGRRELRGSSVEKLLDWRPNPSASSSPRSSASS